MKYIVITAAAVIALIGFSHSVSAQSLVVTPQAFEFTLNSAGNFEFPFSFESAEPLSKGFLISFTNEAGKAKGKREILTSKTEDEMIIVVSRLTPGSYAVSICELTYPRESRVCSPISSITVKEAPYVSIQPISEEIEQLAAAIEFFKALLLQYGEE